MNFFRQIIEIPFAIIVGLIALIVKAVMLIKNALDKRRDDQIRAHIERANRFQ